MGSPAPSFSPSLTAEQPGGQQYHDLTGDPVKLFEITCSGLQFSANLGARPLGHYEILIVVGWTITENGRRKTEDGNCKDVCEAR